MQIKVVIVDDEFPARKYLSSLLTLLFPEKILVVAECDSVKNAVIAIHKHAPDLVFLDIQMPDESGLELSNYFTTADFKIIFTTAFKDFALDAFKINALDYLLKPLTVSDVRDAISRYEASLISPANTKTLQPLNEVSQNLYDRKLVISTKKGFEVLNINDILYCKAEESYTHFYTKDGAILASKGFKESCSYLLEPTFIRVHKSYIVNVNFIKSFNTAEYSLVLLNGEIIPVSDKSFTKKRLMDAISR